MLPLLLFTRPRITPAHETGGYLPLMTMIIIEGVLTFPVVMRGTPAVTVSFYSSFGSGRGTQHINCHGTDCYVDGESQYALYTDLVADAEL